MTFSPTLPASLFDLARAWTLDLVRQPSVTGTPDETAFGPWLAARLRSMPYFADRPGDVWLARTENDARERFVVFALVRGEGERTVVLTGHYDVVSVENYGPLANDACHPERLAPRLVEDLRSRGASAADRLAFTDLASGEFLPGRGLLDMKGGLGAALAVLEAFSRQPDREGNVLFVAVPDEEDASHGMRTAAPLLPSVARARGLDLVGAINLDAETDLGSGDVGRSVFLGSVGKLLPSVLLVGLPAHAGTPFDGVSASLMASELVRLIENNPDFADPGLPDEPGTPPALLQLADSKDRYDVTTPDTVWCAFNLLTRTWGADDVLRAFTRGAEQALNGALAVTRERAERFARLAGTPLAEFDHAPRVLTYAEVRALVDQKGKGAELDALAADLAADADLDTPRVSRLLTEAAVRLADLRGPAAVVTFASLYYPTARLGGTPNALRLRRAVDRVTERLSLDTGERVSVRSFFTGVSDMSFLAGRPAASDVAAVNANSPAHGTRLTFDYDRLAECALPSVNAGPWGRDYHQRTERAHVRYTFGTLPRLLSALCEELLTREPS